MNIDDRATDRFGGLKARWQSCTNGSMPSSQVIINDSYVIGLNIHGVGAQRLVHDAFANYRKFMLRAANEKER